MYCIIFFTAFIAISGRSTRIRTLDPLVPNQVRYRAALHSEDRNNTLLRHSGQHLLVNIHNIYCGVKTCAKTTAIYGNMIARIIAIKAVDKFVNTIFAILLQPIH
jgi:hypothetical protein